MIFGTISSQPIPHRKIGYRLTYLVQLSYPGKSQNTKNDKFCRKQHTVLWLNNVKQYIYTKILWHTWDGDRDELFCAQSIGECNVM